MTARRPASRAPDALPRLLIVGVGRVGGALGRAYQRAGGTVAVVAHSPASLRRARALGLPRAEAEDLARAELCLVAVPDPQIPAVTAQWALKLPPSTVLGHCAGALGLSAVVLPEGSPERLKASFHPLCALAAPTDVLADVSVAVSASAPRALAKCRRVARAMGLRPFSVDDAKRPLYHAGAVLGAGAVAALAGASAEALLLAGAPPSEALRAVLGLMRSALRGVDAHGLLAGLTGPVVRGDVPTVQRHLEALPEPLEGIYRALMARLLQQAAGRLSRAQVRELRQVLTARSFRG